MAEGTEGAKRADLSLPDFYIKRGPNLIHKVGVLMTQLPPKEYNH